MAKLTRAERITKLGRAIWEYRGQYHKGTEKWLRPPNPSALPRVRHWLEALGVIDVEVAVKRIDALKSHEAYSSFLKEVERG